ncbi:5-oxoprolinase subunit C family protein [Aquipseudomonas ullengensis]|uniref:Biotin-dependent carboxyltransferase family protein n=1 Tax=Aquipseudomonas ullengensis TaxID=2759166 RepID=A0A7W4LLQ5_9GAMM|nr:biotin-dependent carboxyltransferase family protein [Pseudomonas ullengensis]MBB2495460.1 biotin-dependent carboxyltransferase family protein [Pseudomonas ullengensis]
MSGLQVLKAGPLSVLQDAGRPGWQHLGVSPSGPLDGHAAAWANHLLENPWGAPLLEVALGDVELHSQVDTWLALTGADLPASIDGAPVPAWSRFPLRAGQRLRLGFARSGQRGYLAAPGGFAAPQVLGSCATQIREGLGGLDGQGSKLQAGDLLPCAAASLACAASVPWPYQPNYRDTPLLRVITGGDALAFAEAQLQAFLEQSWQLSPQSDRMGARLQGEPLQAPHRQWSLGVTRGAIQVPPDGQPIILQADHQTMGGYPLLGWLHPLDLWRLAQCPAQQVLRFTSVTVGEAQAELRGFYRFFGR